MEATQDEEHQKDNQIAETGFAQRDLPEYM
jgi:hypothetical protein